jgi:hypothetical protein
LEGRWKVGSEGEKDKKQVIVLRENLTLSDEVSITLSRAVQATVTTATWVMDYLGLRGEERKAAEEVIELAGRAAKNGNELEGLKSQGALVFLLAKLIRQQREGNWKYWLALAVSIVVAVVGWLIALGIIRW